MDNAESLDSAKHLQRSIQQHARMIRRSHDRIGTRISLRQWRIFHAVYDSGSFAAAGKRLHLTQPTISYAIAQLQEQLGVRMFKNEGRKSILTEDGKTLLNRSRHLLKAALELERFASKLREEIGSN
ncbi:LysR family transcriptional regulator [Noviherbaspirillum saxi]|uniref:LysR family transcriptional regulator n=1 Tax=Noviherbaspirillum saxi TaxID=2320863 RepID=A0A3A3FMD7_9BURK|nr:LysR family transcriptional regulator [Noviherbaspirillum saxi]RJF92505.1 LysR family transcriptional regulator [Noviherbaspirillum saxi]